MDTRKLGNSDLNISKISMGCWAIGGAWGDVSDEDSRAALNAAVDQGVNFFDTADVYGDGRSERLVGELVRNRPEKLYVATKAGRRLSPHTVEGYNKQNLTAFVERSLENLKLDTVDLLQLHCPPTEVYYRPEVFGILDDLKAAGKIRHYGVSVEKVEEGLKALEFPGVRSIQIIYNIFRQRPADTLLEKAQANGVGILARVPLASGLLTGKLTSKSKFAADDHREFNRNGEVFDVGETFAGVPYDIGLEAVEELRSLLPEGVTLPQFALAWILHNPAITCAIPGGKTKAQIEDNARAASIAALSGETMASIRALYDLKIAPHVHQRW